MEHKRVVLGGIPVLVVPENPGTVECDKCVFGCTTCPTTTEERSAGIAPCTLGEHYYAADPTPPTPIPTTTAQWDQIKRLALDYHAELGKLSLTEHSHVLRILQSELGKRRTAALFKPK